MYYSSDTDFFSQFTPMYMPKKPENAPAQGLTHLRHCIKFLNEKRQLRNVL